MCWDLLSGRHGGRARWGPRVQPQPLCPVLPQGVHRRHRAPPLEGACRLICVTPPSTFRPAALLYLLQVFPEVRRIFVASVWEPWWNGIELPAPNFILRLSQIRYVSPVWKPAGVLHFGDKEVNIIFRYSYDEQAVAQVAQVGIPHEMTLHLLVNTTAAIRSPSPRTRPTPEPALRRPASELLPRWTPLEAAEPAAPRR